MNEQPILAAGGIVVRGNTRPTIAVVQLRKDGNWVLPKGKLNRGEDARTAAQREVHEETGHTVTVKEFVGTLCYEVNGRSKIVQFWRMHPNGGQARELMDDIKQVAWLPLDKAIRKLARPHERAFLASAGPAAIKSHRQTTAIRAVPAPAAGETVPVVEQAPFVETAPVIEAESAIEPVPAIALASAIEPAPAIEPASAVEPAPAIEPASAIEPATTTNEVEAAVAPTPFTARSINRSLLPRRKLIERALIWLHRRRA